MAHAAVAADFNQSLDVQSNVSSQVALNFCLLYTSFCGPLAFVNDADGEIYSIDWLVEHTPQEYIDAQLPLDQVQAVIDKTASDEFRFYDLAETAQQKLDIARTLSSDPGSSDEQTAPSDTSASFTE